MLPLFRLKDVASLNQAAGAVAIEMDIRVTSDGVAVGMHDATLERTTNGKGKVSAVTWDYIQTLDAGPSVCAREGRSG